MRGLKHVSEVYHGACVAFGDMVAVGAADFGSLWGVGLSFLLLLAWVLLPVLGARRIFSRRDL
ncbi:hypothetical protein [Pontibacter pamirensis]|uniref:hypothetical protein n=1 Tax=Pontibacter pamirensis TaxID=2562824 RepID=UPI00192E5B78|nr:hypothetical protein [Pontibacter pamirensis]